MKAPLDFNNTRHMLVAIVLGLILAGSVARQAISGPTVDDDNDSQTAPSLSDQDPVDTVAVGTEETLLSQTLAVPDSGLLGSPGGTTSSVTGRTGGLPTENSMVPLAAPTRDWYWYIGILAVFILTATVIGILSAIGILQFLATRWLTPSGWVSISNIMKSLRPGRVVAGERRLGQTSLDFDALERLETHNLDEQAESALHSYSMLRPCLKDLCSRNEYYRMFWLEQLENLKREILSIQAASSQHPAEPAAASDHDPDKYISSHSLVREFNQLVEESSDTQRQWMSDPRWARVSVCQTDQEFPSRGPVYLQAGPDGTFLSIEINREFFLFPCFSVSREGWGTLQYCFTVSGLNTHEERKSGRVVRLRGVALCTDDGSGRLRLTMKGSLEAEYNGKNGMS